MAAYESEHIAETVRNYEVLYNKAHPEFHRKDIKRKLIQSLFLKLALFFLIWRRLLLLKITNMAARTARLFNAAILN